MQLIFNLVARVGSLLIKRSPEMQQPDFLAEKIKRGEVKKILLIQLQQLGDNLVFTPTVKAIVENLGHLHIDMLVNSVGYQVYKNIPQIKTFYVDSTWYWSKGDRKLLPLLKLLLQIRKERYDLAILDVTCIALKYPIISFLTGAAFRLGLDINGRGFLNNIVPPFRSDKSFVEQNFELLPFLGIERASTALWLPCTESDKTTARALVDKFNQDPSDKLIVIHQGSNWSSKQWFAERWIELCQRLLKIDGARIAFMGVEREREPVERIVSELNNAKRVFSLVGKTTIHELKEFIEQSDLFITVDTGPMHIGNCTDTPMIVLMSAIDKEDRWIQASERVAVIRKEVECKYCLSEHCPLGTKECMSLISVAEVAQMAEAILAQERVVLRKK